MKLTKEGILKLLASVLIAIGVYFMLISYVRDFLIQRNIESLLEVTDEEIRENRGRQGTIDFADVQEVSTFSAIRASLRNTDGIYVIGRIQIEAVDLDLPILNSLTDEAMHLGAGIMVSEQIMGQGNYSLASHHMNNPNLLFSPLDRVEIGYEIVISDDTGAYTYVVTDTMVIPPTKVEVIDHVEGKSLITLITCADNGVNRLMVRGELKE